MSFENSAALAKIVGFFVSDFGVDLYWVFCLRGRGWLGLRRTEGGLSLPFGGPGVKGRDRVESVSSRERPRDPS